MAALTLTLAGIDRTSNVRFESLSVTNTIAANSDVLDMTVVLTSGSTWRPMAGNEVIITGASTREFAGMLLEVTELGRPGAQLQYNCHGRDYLHLFNKKLVNSFSSDLVGHAAPHRADEIVAAVVQQTTDGFSTGGISVGPNAPAERYDYVAPGDIVRKMADLATYAWWIDYTKVVNFVPAAALMAPVSSINLDTNTADAGNFDITESVAQLKNDVIVKGWKQRTSVTYANTFPGDGVSKFFLYGYEPSATTDITATLNGTALSVLVDSVDGSAGDGTGSSGQVFACFDNLGFRFGNYAPTSTETVVITSNYMVPGITEAIDLIAQSTAATREGGDGVHQYAYDSPSLTAPHGDITLADAKAASILQRDAYPRITAKFQSFTQGWRAGQSFVASSTRRFPPSGISKTLYVQQVTKRLVAHPAGGSPTLRYDIIAADSFLAQ